LKKEKEMTEKERLDKEPSEIMYTEKCASLEKEVGDLREFEGLAEKLQKEKEAWEKEKQRL